MVEYLPLAQAVQTLSSEPPAVILARLTGFEELPSAPEVGGAGVLEMTVVDSGVANDVETDDVEAEMPVEDNNVDGKGVEVKVDLVNILVLSGADEVVSCAGPQVVVEMEAITIIYLPAAQFIQLLEPGPAYLPAPQFVHVPPVVAATTVEYFPPGHPVQMVSSDPEPAPYLPGVQATQALDPDPAYFPAVQSTHVVVPTADEYLPLPQFVHASDPFVPLNLPALHATHRPSCAKR